MGNVVLNKTAVNNFNNSTVLPFTGDRALNSSLDPTQRWLGLAKRNSYFTIDLGAPYFFNSYTAKSMTEATGASSVWNAPDYCNAGYVIKFSSDNQNWVIADNSLSNFASTYTKALNPMPIPYRYVLVAGMGLKINPSVTSIINFQLNEIPLLAGLSISSGTITPAFNPSVKSYTATVDSSVNSINITPTAANGSYKTSVNGTQVSSGSSVPVNLNYGTNTITISNVSPIDNVSYTYTIAVTRVGNPDLSNLTIIAGTLTPAFNSATLSYTVTVNNTVNSVTLTPTAVDAGAAITVNGNTVTSGGTSPSINVSYGTPTAISIVVTSCGQQKTYTVAVRKVSPNLTGLKVTYGRATLNYTPSFTPDNKTYNASLPSTITSVSVTATAEDPSSTLKLGSDALTSGVAYPYSIGGGTSIEIDITQSDGTPASPYIITLVRTS